MSNVDRLCGLASLFGVLEVGVAELLLAMVPLLVLIGLGGILGRKTVYFDSPVIGSLVSAVGVPALLLYSLQLLVNGDGGFASVVGLVLAALCYLLVMAMITALVLGVVGMPVRAYLPALVNPNAAYLGMPVCVALFGPGAAATAMVFSAVVQLSHFTLGVGCLSGKSNWRGMLLNGPLLALLVGMTLLLLDWQLPVVAMQTLEMLARITVPLMLMQLGASVARLPRLNMARLWRPLWLSVFRCGVGALVALTVLAWWPMPEADFQVFVVVASMPVAVVSYVLAVRYNGPADDIALMVLMSLPVSLALVMLFQWWLLP